MVCQFVLQPQSLFTLTVYKHSIGKILFYCTEERKSHKMSKRWQNHYFRVSCSFKSIFLATETLISVLHHVLEPVDKVAAAREFRVLQAALHSSTAYRDSVGWLATGPANEKLAHSTLTLRSFLSIPGVQDAEQQGISGSNHSCNTWPE